MMTSQDATTTQYDMLKRLLARPSGFPHATDDSSHIETHISHLLLVGDYVYKIKKPLDLGFLDFSTLEKRHRCCEEELRLNRRLAPELYLELVAIRGTPEQPSLVGEGEPFEYAVKMRRFQQRELLSHTLPDQDELDLLAQQIAEFHQGIPHAPVDSLWGTPEVVLEPMEENFRQIRRLKHPLLESERLESLQNWTENFMSVFTPLLHERREAGMIRECHGDLHLNNITRFKGRLMPFDGIEFNPALRWIDTLSDLAFLLMDLQHRGLTQAAARLLNDYLEQTGDYAGLPLLPFYLLYRAMVRAKVCAIRFCQSDIGQEEAETVLDEYRRYLDLAESVTSHPPAALLLTHGVSGSGKSHVAGWLSEQLMAIRIRSDVERKRLYPGTDVQMRRYGRTATLTTYAHLLGMARWLLHAGFAVIVDATFLKQSQRQPFFELAEALDTPLLILNCQASKSILQERIAGRAAAGGDPSEADLSVLAMQLSQREPLSEAERDHAILVDSEDFPPQGMVATVLQRLMGQGPYHPTVETVEWDATPRHLS
jgi:aminoglycoside phosphotransferase family enzyme/gluconate kinase